jgi:PTS system nitrogen regulatory IIA component
VTEEEVDLRRVVRKECCAVLEANTKTEALLELIELVVRQGLVRDGETLKRDIFYREQLMSTGIGLGVGVPHVRYQEITEPVIAVGVQPEGIADYQAIDDEIVTVVIMILVAPQQHKEHIRLLSLVVGRIKNLDVKARLLAATSGEEIHAILTGDES